MANLGDKVRDTVSGFEGIVTGEHNYLNGCTRLTVQPKVDKEGKLPECQTFDAPQLEVIKSKVALQGDKEPGGPMPYIDKERQTDKRRG